MSTEIDNYENNEKILISAICNLWKKIDYLNLCNKYDNGDIDENEFSKELESFPGQYVIDATKEINQNEFNLMIGIIRKIKHRRLDQHEMSEMFGIDFDEINKYITSEI